MTKAHRAVTAVFALGSLVAGDARAQHEGDHGPDEPASTIAHAGMDHDMWSRSLVAGWEIVGMAQVFPIVTSSAPFRDDSALNGTGLYLTQPAAMVNVTSPGSGLVLRVTPNFEGLTQPDGERTIGAWGESFIDARHPHTILHEAMLSLNLWDAPGGALSISAGKGFAPYGTDDPMARPVVKYPTNHHLSQILERWTVNVAYLTGGWGVEAGVFGGTEPDGPYDFSNVQSFPDSWSARLSRRFGGGFGPFATWELTASFASVREEGERTQLYNAAARHAKAYRFGTLYALLEASRSQAAGDAELFSLLGETQVNVGRHAPYYRVEYATRPEYEREGRAGTDAFFHYDHHAPAIGATRWLINSVGYGFRLTEDPYSARVFAEAQHHRVWAERGGIEPDALFGSNSVWSMSLGLRIYIGGGPMRMGTYGVLDPMTVMRRQIGDGGATLMRH